MIHIKLLRYYIYIIERISVSQEFINLYVYHNIITYPEIYTTTEGIKKTTRKPINKNIFDIIYRHHADDIFKSQLWYKVLRSRHYEKCFHIKIWIQQQQWLIKTNKNFEFELKDEKTFYLLWIIIFILLKPCCSLHVLNILFFIIVY